MGRASEKQRLLSTWWSDGSDYADMDGVIAEGSIRSGKTWSIIFGFILWSNARFSRQSFIVAGRSMGALKRNVVNPMLRIIRGMGWRYEYNRSEGFITIGTNTYYLFGASTEASQDVLQGLTAAGCLADEVALFPQSFVEQMVGRCSVDGSKLWFDCNPRYPTHFFKTDWIDRAADKRLLHIKFTMDDNPSLSQGVKERYERMYTGVFYDRYILGLWTLAEGLIYDRYQEAVESRYTGEVTEHAVSIDYGTQNAFHALLWANDGQTWHCVDEYRYSGREQGHQKTDGEYGEDMERFCPREATVIIDPSAASFIAEMQSRGFSVLGADNDVLDGIRHVSTCMSTGRIRIGDNCVGLIEELAGYVWDEKNPDKPTKENDHGCDALRYMVETLDVWDGREAYEPGVIFR